MPHHQQYLQLQSLFEMGSKCIPNIQCFSSTFNGKTNLLLRNLLGMDACFAKGLVYEVTFASLVGHSTSRAC